MKEYFISEILINKLDHLSNIKIELNPTERRHLLLTGENGSGKTSLLLYIEEYLKAINDEAITDLLERYLRWKDEAREEFESAETENERFRAEKKYKQWSQYVEKYYDGVQVTLNEYDGLEQAYQKGEFITAYFPAERKARFAVPNGVENIELQNAYRIDGDAGNVLLKYMVHLKTQQAYARNEGVDNTVQIIQQWFDRFEKALQILLDEKSIHL